MCSYVIITLYVICYDVENKFFFFFFFRAQNVPKLMKAVVLPKSTLRKFTRDPQLYLGETDTPGKHAEIGWCDLLWA